MMKLKELNSQVPIYLLKDYDLNQTLEQLQKLKVLTPDDVKNIRAMKVGETLTVAMENIERIR